QAASCVAGGVMSASICDGKGTCVQGPTIDCEPFLCDPSTSKCFLTCTSNAQCATGRTCNGSGLCGSKPLGAACNATSECNPGSTCANNVCCGTPCDRSCCLCNL